jgi:SAM-dependent methyltransferase
MVPSRRAEEARCGRIETAWPVPDACLVQCPTNIMTRDIAPASPAWICALEMRPAAQPWCNICGHAGPFLDLDAGREGLICRNCSASSRQRALLYVLGAWLGAGQRPLIDWEPNQGLCVLEASGRGAYPMLLGEKLRYVNTEYPPAGATGDATFSRFADLEHLPYADATLDVILAADVFEHVRHDGRAFAEVHRVLKPGGALVFTVPYDPQRPETLIRVKVKGDVDVPVMEPEYHGGGGRSLAYRTYGRDLPDQLRDGGFTVGLWDVEVPAHAITRQTVFLCSRGASIDLTRLLRQRAAPSPIAPSSVPLVPFRLLVMLKYNVRAARQLAAQLRARLGR